MKQDKSVDEYLKELPEDKRASLQHVRSVVKKLVPEVEEVISYAVPAFRYRGRILLYCAAFKNHMSIYPASDEMIKEVGEQLKSFRTSKGTLQFSAEKPMPDNLLKKIIGFRKAEIDNKV